MGIISVYTDAPITQTWLSGETWMNRGMDGWIDTVNYEQMDGWLAEWVDGQRPHILILNLSFSPQNNVLASRSPRR